MPTSPRYTLPPRARTIALTVAAVVFVGATVFACAESIAPDDSGTFFGPVTVMASGTGRAYVTLDRAGIPTELGLAITEASLTGLPVGAAEYEFELPPQATATTPYRHVGVNWQPTGHQPAMIYTLPHFDVHFFMITSAERGALLLGDAQLLAKMTRMPGDAFIPTGYVTGNPTARMGMHWTDPNAPERKGALFTKTFIYGSYDGTFIFGEPMVTKAYLETKPAADVTTINQPAQYASTGYQPTTYTIGFDAAAKEYRIALTGLVKR